MNEPFFGHTDVIQRESDEKAVFVIAAGCSDGEIAVIKAALEILFHKPCYDLTTMISKHPEHIRKWIELDKRLLDSSDKVDEEKLGDCDLIRDILQGYACAVDFPVISYYWFVMQAYPSAKIVIAYPDTVSWSRYLRKIRDLRKQLDDTKLEIKIPSMKNGHDIGEFLDRVCYRLLGSENKLATDQSIADSLANWIQDGRARIPSERLLVYNTDDEWEPLCEFLGMEIPDEPFPEEQDQRPLSTFFDIIKNGENNNINRSSNNDDNTTNSPTTYTPTINTTNTGGHKCNTKDDGNNVISNNNKTTTTNIDDNIKVEEDINNTSNNKSNDYKHSLWGFLPTVAVIIAIGALLGFMYKRKSHASF
ncbi:hypothetical protein D915_005752 [Fasciola hepatica]|uniref:Uncharacterized protein n=1 Tax=Fasciola hepatica TaxID=6192 RepID=A0A4E0S089_FASHE|nr:hypothetical protein D915_005752 [Fasciola hepatica]